MNIWLTVWSSSCSTANLTYGRPDHWHVSSACLLENPTAGWDHTEVTTPSHQSIENFASGRIPNDEFIDLSNLNVRYTRRIFWKALSESVANPICFLLLIARCNSAWGTGLTSWIWHWVNDRWCLCSWTYLFRVSPSAAGEVIWETWWPRWKMWWAP